MYTYLNTICAVLFNITVSLSIVMVNKYLYVHVRFPNMTLTFMHFITTFLSLQICQIAGMFSIKKVPILAMLPLALNFCGFVVLTNLSLGSNTVGTYQLAKVMTTPCVLLIQYLSYRKSTSKKIQATVVPIVVGVTLNFMYDIKLTTLGTIYALSGVVVTSFYQVMVGEKQKEFELNSMQLLYYQAPLSALILLLPALYFEPVSSLLTRTWTTTELAAIVCSCLIAFAVNISIYWIIGNTSAMTYNMTGHTKFCITTAAGYVVFGEEMSFNQVIGFLLTLGGIICYTHFRMQENDKMKKKQMENEKYLLTSCNSIPNSTKC